MYLDTNGISTFFRASEGAERTESLRTRLRAALAADKLVLLASGIAVQELFAMAGHDWPKYRELLAFVQEVTGKRLLLRTAELWLQEYSLGRRLSGDERFESEETVVDLYRQADRQAFVAAVSDDATSAAERFAAEETARRADVLARFKELGGEEDPAAGVRKWWRGNADAQIESWTRRDLTALLVKHAKPPPGDDLNVRDLPTIWNYHAYKMARIVLNVGEGRRIRPSDAADADHYVDAAYADVFVSDDRDLHATIAAIPNRAIMPIRFAEFKTRFLPA